MTEDGPATADLSALGQGGALSPQRCLYITGLELSFACYCCLAQNRDCCEIESERAPLTCARCSAAGVYYFLAREEGRHHNARLLRTP